MFAVGTLNLLLRIVGNFAGIDLIMVIPYAENYEFQK